MKIQSNKTYRFTLSNPEDEPEHVDDLMRQRYNGADVLVLGVGIALAEVEALDGGTFRAWHHELTDVAATEPIRFVGFRPVVNDLAVPPLAVGGSSVRRKLDRDRDVAQSTFDEITENIARVGSTDEKDLMVGSYSMGVADYASYLATGEASERLRNLLDL